MICSCFPIFLLDVGRLHVSRFHVSLLMNDKRFLTQGKNILCVAIKYAGYYTNFKFYCERIFFSIYYWPLFFCTMAHVFIYCAPHPFREKGILDSNHASNDSNWHYLYCYPNTLEHELAFSTKEPFFTALNHTQNEAGMH